jgi:ABC-type Zn uptake system ZnuABC Zn-binding protein ZnuA
MFALAGCGGGSGAGQEASGPRVVATHSILGDIVGNVGGDGIELTTLVAAGEDPHVFEPSPSDSAALSEAEVVFENGLEYETWLDDMYESSGSEAERVAATDGLEPIEGGHEEHSDEGHEKEERGDEEHSDEHGDDEHSHEGDEHADEASHDHGDEGHSDDEHADEESHDHGDEEHSDEHGDEEHADDDHGDHESEGNGDDHGHAHGEFDPHVWGDVGNAISMTEAVRDALVETDADNADLYRENASEYIAELRELEASVEESVSGVPEENRKLITAHDTFGYFAEAYDFEVVGTAIEGFTTEASDPAAGDIAELSDGIRATGVPAIFPETTTNEAIMERIANEAGVELAPPLYTDALGEEGSEGDTYIGMTEYNASTIADALE